MACCCSDVSAGAVRARASQAARGSLTGSGAGAEGARRRPCRVAVPDGSPGVALADRGRAAAAQQRVRRLGQLAAQPRAVVGRRVVAEDLQEQRAQPRHVQADQVPAADVSALTFFSKQGLPLFTIAAAHGSHDASQPVGQQSHAACVLGGPLRQAAKGPGMHCGFMPPPPIQVTGRPPRAMSVSLPEDPRPLRPGRPLLPRGFSSLSTWTGRRAPWCGGVRQRVGRRVLRKWNGAGRRRRAERCL